MNRNFLFRILKLLFILDNILMKSLLMLRKVTV